MTTPTKKNEFRTPDLYFSAFLICAGVPLTGTTRENNRVFFIFNTEIADMEELKQGWYSSTAKVSALGYSSAIKNLKSLVHMS